MEFIRYIPIITTLLSAWFFIRIFDHWKRKKNSGYLLMWSLGVFFFGAGTLVESTYAFTGWTPVVFKLWYIFGALLGGIFLAQGTVHLLMKSETAKILTILVIMVLVVSSILVFASPLNTEVIDPDRLTGAVLEWQFIRLITPFINIYAFIFLVGGAIYSAIIYFMKKISRARAWGNIWIAIGGILPGIGGSFTKFGYTEVLYVTELLGLILIFTGYLVIKNDKSRSVHKVQVNG